jgi:predicted small secreted protein
MKKMFYLSLALATAVCLSGCNTPQGQNAAGGAVIGGATGAVIGGAVSNSAGGALAGGLLGATAGAMIGSAATPQDPGYAPPPRRCAEWGYDYYGNRVCRAFY